MAHLAHRFSFRLPRGLAAGMVALGMASGSGMACGGVSSPPSPQAGAQSAEVAVAALHAVHAAGSAVVVDVRTADEFAQGHVPGAIHIPVDQLESRLAELDTHRESDLYLICRSGSRSARAQGVLAAAGFSRPINVAGGTLAWIAAGYPVE